MPSTREQIEELRQKRCQLVSEARGISNKAWDDNKREMRADEQSDFDRAMGEVDKLKERMDKLEKLAGEEDESERDEGDTDVDTDRGDDDDSDKKDDDERGSKRPKGEKRGMNRPRSNPSSNGGAKLERRAGEPMQDFKARERRSSPEYRQAFAAYCLDGLPALSSSIHRRAIAADSDIVGGYMVMPQELYAGLIKFVDNITVIRQRATKHMVKSAQSLGAPSLDIDLSDADWTSELDTGNEDTSMAFGKRELTPKPLAKRAKISNKLLRMAQLTGGYSADGSAVGGGADGLVMNRLAYKFGITEEIGFMTGNGVNQPLGLFTASGRGISTGRDVSAGSTTGYTADALIAAKYNMKAQYWPTLEWLFHRDGLRRIRQLKDSNGQYLWVPSGLGATYTGFSQGADRRTMADTLLDFPVIASEYVPNTFTTGQYVGMLGDFSFYWIADADIMTVQRLVELYAAANQTGYIARREIDGMPVLEEAFTRLKTD